jgi:hypothetical protein
VRHWNTWCPYSKRNHLFLLPLDIDPASRALSHASVSGQIKPPVDASSSPSSPYTAYDVMQNWHSDCPGKAAGADASSFTVSPDGTKIAFACRSVLPGRGQPEDMPWSTETSIFMCDVPEFPCRSECAAGAVKVSGDGQGSKATPVFSPCSRYIA